MFVQKLFRVLIDVQWKFCSYHIHEKLAAIIIFLSQYALIFCGKEKLIESSAVGIEGKSFVCKKPSCWSQDKALLAFSQGQEWSDLAAVASFYTRYRFLIVPFYEKRDSRTRAMIRRPQRRQIPTISFRTLTLRTLLKNLSGDAQADEPDAKVTGYVG